MLRPSGPGRIWNQEAGRVQLALAWPGHVEEKRRPRLIPKEQVAGRRERS